MFILNIHFNNIFPCKPRSSKWFFLEVSPPKSCTHVSSHLYMPQVPPNNPPFEAHELFLTMHYSSAS